MLFVLYTLAFHIHISEIIFIEPFRFAKSTKLKKSSPNISLKKAIKIEWVHIYGFIIYSQSTLDILSLNYDAL